MPNFRRLFYLSCGLFTLVTVIVHINPRRLRFFDPDHRHCGKSALAHQFAIHAVYGARMSEENYYNRLTVSTSDELPRNKAELHKILQVLAHVAQRTGRAIRVNQSRLPGYDSEYLQPYSLVSAPVLHEFGVELVEQGYWHRAVQTQDLKKPGQFVAKEIAMHRDPLGVLAQLVNDESIHEYLFSVKELLVIPQDRLTLLVGKGLGYDFKTRRWRQTFSCGHEEIEDKDPIPIMNDPLSPP